MTCPFTTNKLPLLVLHDAIFLSAERVEELTVRIDRELIALEGQGSAGAVNTSDAAANEKRPIVLFCAASCWNRQVYRDTNTYSGSWRAFNWTHEFPWKLFWLYRQIAADPSPLSVRGIRHRWRVTKVCSGILQIAQHYNVPMIAVVSGGAVCADAARVALQNGWCKPAAGPLLEPVLP